MLRKKIQQSIKSIKTTFYYNIGWHLKNMLISFILGDNFMIWNLKDYGDPLEKKALNFIESNGLGGYKNFWDVFVGNIKGKPAPLRNTIESKNEKRLLLAQWNYSILKNLYIIHRLKVDRYNKHRINTNNLNDVTHYDRDYILSTHLTYNNLELLDKISNLIKYKKNNSFHINKHNGFVSFRNLMTHNIKPLTKINYHYEVPKNLDWFNEKGVETKNFIWSNSEFFEGLEYQPINEYLSQCIEFIITDFKEILTYEFSFMNYLFKQTPKTEIVDVPQSNILKTKIYESISGTTKE